jgi:hypothetical protein
VEGTGGGQTVVEEPGADAVVIAACVDVSGISPGNSKGAWDDADAEPVAPVAPPADPLVFVDPVDVPSCDADEVDDTDDADDREDVGALRGSDPVVVPLLFV